MTRRRTPAPIANASGLIWKRTSPASTNAPTKIAVTTVEVEAVAAIPSTQRTTRSQEHAESILVIAVRDERIATLLGDQIRAWVLNSGNEVKIHVIVSQHFGTDEDKIAALLASLHYRNLKPMFPNIQLGWPSENNEL